MRESHAQTCVPQTFPLLQGQADCTGWEAMEQEGQAAWRDLDSVFQSPLVCESGLLLAASDTDSASRRQATLNASDCRPWVKPLQ